MRISIACILLVFYGHITSAQPLENSLLWRISGKSLKAPSYLYGTTHRICAQDYVLRGRVIRAMDSCAQIAFEANIVDSVEMENTQKSMLKAQKLKDLLSQAEYKQLLRLGQTVLHLSEQEIDQMSPLMMMFATYKLATPDCVAASAEAVIAGVARSNERYYNRSKRPFIGLENWEDQARVFDQKISLILAKTLRIMLERMQTLGKNNRAKFLVQGYKQENLNAIAKTQEAIDMNTAESTLLNDKILKERNKLWLPRMEAAMLQKPTFFAVGVMHLIGNNGLILMLRHQGYRVTAVLPERSTSK